jgi:VWFA-related protein
MRISSVLSALVLGLPLAAAAQLAPSPDEAPVSHAPAAPEEPMATFKVEVNLVDVFFTVRAKDGILAPHLTRDECTILEDKVPQTLKTFQAENDLPLTIGMAIDTSGSQERVLPLEQDAGSQFLQRILKKKDQAFVLSFDVNVDLLQDSTNSVRLLTRALNKTEINSGVSFGASPVPTPGGPRGTVLYDAVYLAANEKMRQETGRKALILLTDGEDEGSRVKINDAIAAAEKSNVTVYVILIADVQGYLDQGLGYSGYSPMKKLAEETGGRVINVGNNAKKLQEAFDQIEEELRTQYVATYKPGNTKKDGTFRHISVECKGEGFKVRTRKGYYAPREGADE